MVPLRRPNLRRDKVGVVVELMLIKAEPQESILSAMVLGHLTSHGEAHRSTP